MNPIIAPRFCFWHFWQFKQLVCPVASVCAGQISIGKPPGVFVVVASGTRQTTGPIFKAASLSAWRGLLPDKFTVNPARFAARILSRFLAVGGLWVYVKPRRPRFAAIKSKSAAASIVFPWPGKSPAWLCRHSVPAGKADTASQKAAHGVFLSPVDTFRQCMAKGPELA